MRELLAKRLTEPCRTELTSYCPSMDLVATVTQTHKVDVWRMNAQRVFGLAPDEDDNYAIEGLAWRSDGTLLPSPAICCGCRRPLRCQS
jgi:anaphase-promoting complex subunit 4